MSVRQHQAVSSPDKRWIGALRDFAAKPPAVEHCELCRAEIGQAHSHLIEPGSRQLLCACQACALLFSNPEGSRYRRVPTTLTRLHDFKLTEQQWDALLIPINMAFFFRSSVQQRVLAMYPGPAGAAESMLDLEAWADVEAANPVLDELQEDVEALLVYRIAGAREYYRVPIDRCYALVGELRTHWHGVSGGQGTREAIQAFFAGLRDETADANGAATGALAHA